MHTNSFTSLEKKYFEDLFDMDTGYVLDFSNNTFASFFKESVSINIYDVKYSIYGDSKAKRLRAFWEMEPDKLVSKSLKGMLDIWEYNNSENAGTNTKYNKCLQIVRRLSGGSQTKETTANDFLSRKIDMPSLDKLGLDTPFTTILNSRLKEVERNLNNKAPLSAIWGCGSILEGILLGFASKDPAKFNRSSASPKDENGKPKQFYQWSLSQFIDVACDVKLIKLDVKKFSHVLRDFRNYIHPYQQLLQQFNPDQHTADICYQVLKAAIADLSGER